MTNTHTSVIMGSMRTSLELYRDCLRLIKHMAGSSSPKAVHLRSILSSQFREHKHEMDPARIQALKAGCVVGTAGRCDVVGVKRSGV